VIKLEDIIIKRLNPFEVPRVRQPRQPYSENAVFVRGSSGPSAQWDLFSVTIDLENPGVYPQLIPFSTTVPFNSVTNYQHIPSMIDKCDKLWRQELYDALTSQLDFEVAIFVEYEIGYTITDVPSSRGKQLTITGEKTLVAWNWSYKPPPPQDQEEPPISYPTSAKDIAAIVEEE